MAPVETRFKVSDVHQGILAECFQDVFTRVRNEEETLNTGTAFPNKYSLT